MIDFKFRDFLAQLLFKFTLLSLFVHEYGHLLAVRLMGYEGEIRSSALASVYLTSAQGITELEYRFFYLSGGLFQAAVFLLMCISNEDAENRLVNKMVAVYGVVYGCFEAFTPRVWWSAGGVAGILLAVVFMGATLVAKNKLAQSPVPPIVG